MERGEDTHMQVIKQMEYNFNSRWIWVQDMQVSLVLFLFGGFYKFEFIYKLKDFKKIDPCRASFFCYLSEQMYPFFMPWIWNITFSPSLSPLFSWFCFLTDKIHSINQPCRYSRTLSTEDFICRISNLSDLGFSVYSPQVHSRSDSVVCKYKEVEEFHDLASQWSLLSS